jgi:hypothetical protein
LAPGKNRTGRQGYGQSQTNCKVPFGFHDEGFSGNERKNTKASRAKERVTSRPALKKVRASMIHRALLTELRCVDLHLRFSI